MDATTLLDRLTIRQLVEDWAVLRDARQWDRFREVWHEDGRMMATWFQGSRDEFIKVSEEGYQKGVRILHFLGGSTIDLSGTRAIAQTKMTISQRAKVDGVLCDVVCTGRFYDFFEKRGRWGLVLRQPIYEKDRLDPLDPSAKLELDSELLARFPEGYRHLAYLQTRIGYTVKPRHAGAGWAGGGGAVCEGREVVGGGEALAVSRTRCSAASGASQMRDRPKLSSWRSRFSSASLRAALRPGHRIISRPPSR